MLLTNMLPNQGNGTFTLSAFIRSNDGASVFLGSKTIVASNANATAPFGTIDTPGQGQSVFGTITKFRWALTPQPNIIPTGGSNRASSSLMAPITSSEPEGSRTTGISAAASSQNARSPDGVVEVPHGESAIPPFGVVESPSPDAVVAGRIVVSGWALALNDVPVSVDLLVDGVVVSRAQMRWHRADSAGSAFRESLCDAPTGFCGCLDTTGEAVCAHRIAIRVLDPTLAFAVIGGREVIVER